MSSVIADRKRRREAMIRQQEREATLRVLEDAVATDIRTRLTHAEIAAKRHIGVKFVQIISRRLQAEGKIGSYYKLPRQPDEVCHEADDARARAVLSAHGVRYRSIAPESLDNPVAAMRNGAAVRMPLLGGSVAGACADAGAPVL